MHQFRIQVCFRFRFRLLVRLPPGMLVCRRLFFSRSGTVFIVSQVHVFFSHLSLKVTLGFNFMAVHPHPTNWKHMEG